MSKSIVLIGLSGCGKTTYGKQLSEKLDWPFFDVDQIIENRENMPVSEIFRLKGESYFRALEWQVFRELIVQEPSIIATGGGLVPHAYLMHYPKPEGVFFLYLNVSTDVIYKRLQDPLALSQRPLLAKETGLKEKIEALSRERSAAYLAWADAIVTNT